MSYTPVILFVGSIRSTNKILWLGLLAVALTATPAVPGALAQGDVVFCIAVPAVRPDTVGVGGKLATIVSHLNSYWSR